SYISYAEARPTLEALAEDLPPELKRKSSGDVKAAWPAWVARRDAEIRGRLIQGDEDSLVNFLLFGTSFTRQPRITGKQVILLARVAAQHGIGTALAAPSAEESKLDEILIARI